MATINHDDSLHGVRDMQHQFVGRITGKLAETDLLAGRPVTLDPTTDMFRYAAAGEAIAGITNKLIYAGNPVTVFGLNARFNAVSDQSLTQQVYYADAGGLIDDAPTGVDDQGMFIRVSADDLQVVRTGALV